MLKQQNEYLNFEIRKVEKPGLDKLSAGDVVVVVLVEATACV
jgi:hypothetical protein